MARLHVLLVVALCFAATACSTTLKMRSGQKVSGHVESADQNFVYVVLDEPRDAREALQRASYAQALLGPEGERGSDERVYRVHRAAIRDVRPPGRAAAIVGTVLLTAGLVFIAGGYVQYALNEEDDFRGAWLNFTLYGGGVTAVGGLLTMIPGWAIYGTAAARARPSASSPSSQSGEGGLTLVNW